MLFVGSKPGSLDDGNRIRLPAGVVAVGVLAAAEAATPVDVVPKGSFVGAWAPESRSAKANAAMPNTASPKQLNQPMRGRFRMTRLRELSE